MNDPCVRMLGWLTDEQRRLGQLATEANRDGKQDVANYYTAKRYALHQAADQLRFYLGLEERA